MRYTSVESYVRAGLKSASKQNGYSISRNTDSLAAHGTTWAFTGIGVHRDSGILDRSNWEVISEDIMKRFPRHAEVIHMNHWAVGWYDHLHIQMITKRGKPTKAAIAVYDWLEKLDDYPVANEGHWSEMEMEANLQGNERSILDFARFGSIGKYPNRISIETVSDMPDGDDLVNTVCRWLYENDPDSLEHAEVGYHGDDNAAGYIDDMALCGAFYALGWIDRDQYDDSTWAAIEQYLADYVGQSIDRSIRDPWNWR